jgi:preprotein translocase subunit SecF
MKIIDFMGSRKLALGLSLCLILGSISSLVVRQLNWGLDFTGGTLLELHYSGAADLDAIRNLLTERDVEGAMVVAFGSEQDVLIRLPAASAGKDDEAILQALQAGYDGDVELRRTEFVGPQVGEELREKGGLAMLLASGLIMLYISFRFQSKFAVAAVTALIHDVLITLGFFSITGLEFNLTVLAALLAVIGYSINDTIVVFDRLRENFRRLRDTSVQDTINASLNETLGRTVVTSLTTLLVLVALAIYGGDMIFGFALALLIGVIVGTYSSVYVASSLLMMLGVSRRDLIVPATQDQDADASTP